ncbi:hypothetical protein [Thalassobellus citreus]|uniref:hypothetical protein n=1 Tax=Thalassobellus citreus TaxID=3367752 RepID=UPI0037A07652
MKSNLLFIFLILGVLSCKEKPTRIPSSKLTSKSNKKIEFKKIDFSNSEFADLKMYAKDTITSDGLKINYLVKNDNTKRTDLYIKWSKGEYSNIFMMENALLMRKYFIPILTEHNDKYIYMTHGCATSCYAVLTLSKEAKPKAKDFLEVIAYNTHLNQIVYTPESSYSLETFEIAISDLKKGIDKSVKFKNKCNLSPENGCIDKIVFNEEYIDIFATLFNSETSKTIQEQNRIKITE